MNEIETTLVESLEQYLQEMVPNLGFQRMPVYRGQSSSEWRILPSLFREQLERTEFKTWAELEGAFLLQLKQRGRGELGYEPHSELEWMSIGEHYGMPTRLSSWTENALVALWFATERNGNEDGVVWRILPGETSLTISQDYEQVPELPRIYKPQKMTAAMLNQKTCYLSHPIPSENATPESFEEVFELGTEKMHLARLVIPAAEKDFLRRRLTMMGIDSRMLFPGMAGLCRQLREEIYCHTDSYEWMIPE